MVYRILKNNSPRFKNKKNNVCMTSKANIKKNKNERQSEATSFHLK